ncbi:MAG: UDP-N-acetylmuramate dehydrogenase [Abditibacteriota bacterium]|nr:UDP-N-acetylmuramate dehydrogenase [Abditibacteriota bacterium]
MIPKILEKEIMARHTTLRVGGPADFFAEPNTAEELSELVKYAASENMPLTIFGGGTNLLVADEGIEGLVIKLGEGFTKISVKGTALTAGCGASMAEVADVAARNNLGGLQGAGTVPGTLGGAIVMNAGTHEGNIGAAVRSLTAVKTDGTIVNLTHEECGFTYRNSLFQREKDFILAEAVLELEPADGKAVYESLEAVRRHRRETQPVGFSAGCFFKNREHMSAGRMIDESGCKGMRVGGAYVSDIHANFIMNDGTAAARDLYELAEKVRETVKKEKNVDLEYEVRLIGRWTKK